MGLLTIFCDNDPIDLDPCDEAVYVWLSLFIYNLLLGLNGYVDTGVLMCRCLVCQDFSFRRSRYTSSDSHQALLHV